MKIKFIDVYFIHDDIEYLVHLDKRDDAMIAYKGQSYVMQFPGNREKQETILSKVTPDDVVEFLIGMQIPNLEIFEHFIKG